MKNYFDKYLKYKLKYLKVKNHQYGGETFDCSDKKDTEVICEINPKGQWDNLEECTQSKICIENKKLINSDQSPNEIIQLYRKNKKLLNKYYVYSDDSLPSSLDELNDNIDKINFIEDNKNLIQKYGIVKYTVSGKYETIKAFKLIEENPILKQYKEYNDPNLLNIIMLDKVETDVKLIKEFHNDCMKTEIPRTFYISGLLTFAVYKNIELNKKIYLLGEQHNFNETCDMKNKTDDLLVYNAMEFFNLLAKSFIKDKTIHNSNNKLDVFLEEGYNPVGNNKFRIDKSPTVKSPTDKSLLQYDTGGYLTMTVDNIYSANCEPQYVKNQIREKKDHVYNTDYNLCLFEPYVRYHHADIRTMNDDPIIAYLFAIWLFYMKNDKHILSELSDASDSLDDIKILTSLYTKSKTMHKIFKQIIKIKHDKIRINLMNDYKIFKKDMLNYIESGHMSYSNIKDKKFAKADSDTISNLWLSYMDLYLMGRVFRYFGKTSNNSTNIIIYAGNTHIINYIMKLLEFGFINEYSFTKLDFDDFSNLNDSIDDSEKKACLKVEDFDVKYFLDS